MRKGLQIIMAILMIAAIYCTFKYRVLPSNTDAEFTRTIVIDPGHGGEDPGKVGINEALEKDINLKISFLLKEMLEKEGYKIILTRENDDGLYSDTDGNKKVADMKKRCQIIEDSGAQIVVSIHQNSFSQESVCGAQVFYYKHSTQGRKLAEKIQASIKENVAPDNNRTVKDNASYYMLLHTPCPTVIVECGFLSNYNEAELLVSEEYQEKIAKAICTGINDYFNDSTGN